ncbi:MAG TPA: DUF6263 family protein [Planctomycetota bacterium]|nr:DUF6263 family protein [Planctomycetota bacterium]
MFAVRRISWILAFAIFALCACQDPVVLELRWKLQPGEVLRYRMSVEQSVDAMAGMGDKPMHMTMEAVMRQEIRDVAADGTASVEVSYEAMRFSSDTSAGLNFDSTLEGADADRNDPEFRAMIGPLLDLRLRMKLDPSGKVSELQGVKEMLAAMQARLGKDGEERSVLAMFGEESQMKWLQFEVFPAKPVVSGETWKRSSEVRLPSMGTMTIKNENVLRGVEDHAGRPCAVISSTTRMSLAPEDSSATRMEIKMDGSKGEGTKWFDHERGRMLEAQQTLDTKMSMGSDKDPKDEVRTSMSITMRTLLLGKDDPAFGVR